MTSYKTKKRKNKHKKKTKKTNMAVKYLNYKKIKIYLDEFLAIILFKLKTKKI